MFVPFFGKKQVSRLFFTLMITEGQVRAALWSVVNGGLQVVKHSQSAQWDPTSEKTLTEATDTVLSSFGSQANMTKELLLGLPASWTQGSAIHPSKKHLLKEITTELNLTSVGFVVSSEALIAWYRDRDGASSQGLLVWVDDASVQVSQLVEGKVAKTGEHQRTHELVPDILEAVGSAEIMGCAPHLIVTGPTITPEEQVTFTKELEATTWEPSLFASKPKLEFAESNQIVDAICLSGGREVAKSLGLIPDSAAPRGAAMPAPEHETVGFQAEEIVEAAESVRGDRSEKLDLALDAPAKKKSILPYIGAFLFVLVGLAVAAFGAMTLLKSVAKVSVDVQVKPQTFSFNDTFTADAGAAASDATTHILKASLVTKEVGDTLEGSATGKKDVGEKAKGKVTIANKTTQTKTFKAGTELMLGSLKFTLDNDITVASASSSFDGSTFGKVSTTITAAAIGAEGNISKEQELRVGTFDVSAYAAKTEDDFAGGSSRKVQVVSEQDQKQLAASLYAKLKDQASKAFEEQADGKHVIVSSDLTQVTKEFSDDIGKEAKTFTLTMKGTASALTYTNDDILSYAKQTLAGQITETSVILPEQTTVEIQEQIPLDAQKTRVRASVHMVVVPPLEQSAVLDLIIGKRVKDAQAALDADASIQSAVINIVPAFLRPLVTMIPANSGRVSVKIHM